jgi:Cu-processing system permease protein
MTRAGTIARVVWLNLLRRKDVYVLFILLGVLLVTLVSVNVFGLGRVAGYVKDIGLLTTWVFAWVLAVTVTARELPQEEARRTIFPLLAKPVTRAELIVGKWLGAWSAVSAATLAFYLLLALVALLMGGPFHPATLAQGFLLHAAALAVVCALALWFSARLNPDAAITLTFVLTGAAFLVVPRVPALLVRQAGTGGDALLLLYHVLPHFEVFDLRQRMVFDLGPLPPATFATVLLYGASLAALFLLLAWLAYRHKRFQRGAAGV